MELSPAAAVTRFLIRFGRSLLQRRPARGFEEEGGRPGCQFASSVTGPPGQGDRGPGRPRRGTSAHSQIRVGNRPALALLAPVAPSAGPGGAVRLTLASPPRDVPAPAPG